MARRIQKRGCPACGCTHLYRSRRRLFEKVFLHFFDWVPYRCAACDHRFYGLPDPGIPHGNEAVRRLVSRSSTS